MTKTTYPPARAVRALGRKTETDAEMKLEEIIERLNRICVNLLKRAALEENRVEYMFDVAKVQAEEYRKDATAISLAARIVYQNIKDGGKA